MILNCNKYVDLCVKRCVLCCDVWIITWAVVIREVYKSTLNRAYDLRIKCYIWFYYQSWLPSLSDHWKTFMKKTPNFYIYSLLFQNFACNVSTNNKWLKSPDIHVSLFYNFTVIHDQTTPQVSLHIQQFSTTKHNSRCLRSY